jgi:hypothetical protein
LIAANSQSGFIERGVFFIWTTDVDTTRIILGCIVDDSI